VVNRRRLRVLMASAQYFPHAGGVETHIYEVGRRLVEAGVEVTVMTTDPTGILRPFENSHGMWIRRVRSYPINADYYFAPAMYRMIRQADWDVLHCQGCHTFVASISMAAAYRQGRPYVLTLHSGGHSSKLRTTLRPVQWAVLRPLMARAHRLICVSRFERLVFERRLRLAPEQFALIPNGTSFERADIPRPPSDEGIKLIVSLGRLERYKGHHRVLAALPKIRERCPSARLRIVGSGPYERRLRELAHRLGVTDLVEIRPIAAGDTQALSAVLASASVVTLLSEYESQGISALEAAASGRPLVVARSSALSELAERGLARALSVESGTEEIAAALVDELLQPMQISPPTLPTWDECAAQVLRVYESAVGAA
jgi:glycogen synthase